MNKYKMGHLEGNFTPVLYIWDARFLKVNIILCTYRRRCGDNTKMGLQDARWVSMDWIDLAQDRYRWQVLVNAVMELRGSIKCGEILE